MLAAILCGSLLFDSGRRRYEIMLATVIVIAVGHIGYTWVPGLGPHAWPALTFKHALVGGVWWGRVREAVSAAGAQLDIFPSLHTGLSMSVGLHVLRYRRQKPFTFVWPITTFFVANIIIATVFLRWHYGVDLIAGALLALVAQRIAIVAYRREGNRDLDHARQPLWERIPIWRSSTKGARPRPRDVRSRTWSLRRSTPTPSPSAPAPFSSCASCSRWRACCRSTRW